jgi:hypothetical protein
MAIIYAYEPEYRYAGWFDADSRTVPQWFDRDLVEDVPKKLAVLETELFLDDDVIFKMEGPTGESLITVIVFPSLFLDDDLIFHPVAMRRLGPPDRYLKNEVIRVR